jgi:hypothetical protein
MYFGYEEESNGAVAFQTLDGKTASYTDNGFYVITEGEEIL